VSRIRAEFEEDDGNYSSFQDGNLETSEICNAMEWMTVAEDV